MLVSDRSPQKSNSFFSTFVTFGIGLFFFVVVVDDSDAAVTLQFISTIKVGIGVTTNFRFYRA